MPATEILRLPVLKDSYQTGDVFETQEYRVNKKFTKPVMRGLLRTYGLTESGNKLDMLDRLRELANNPKDWVSHYLAEPTRVRGSATGNRGKRSVAKRTLAMFGDDAKPACSTVSYPLRRAAGVTADHRSADDIKRNRELARRFLETQAAKQEAQQACVHGANEVSEGSHVGSEQSHPSTSPTTSATLNRMATDIRNVRMALSAIEHHVFCTTPSHTAAVMVPVPRVQASSFEPARQPSIMMPPAFDPLPHSSTHPGIPSWHGDATLMTVHPPFANSSMSAATDAGLSVATNILTSAHSTDSPPLEAPAVHWISINGEEFEFTSSDVPDVPKGLSFSDNIDDLFAEWYVSTRVTIRGHAIPLRDWPKIYSIRAGHKRNAWLKYRSTWNNWKQVVLEYEALGRSKTAFWQKHSNARGDRSSFSKICDDLRAERKQLSEAVNGPDAADARLCLGDDLSHPLARHAFEFRKNSKTYLCKTDAQIATRWRRLLKTDQAVRDRWSDILKTRGRPPLPEIDAADTEDREDDAEDDQD